MKITEMDIFGYEKLTGAALSKWSDFMAVSGLSAKNDADYTVIIEDEGKIAACASRFGSTLKYFAVSPDMQGQNLTATLITELTKNAFSVGISHLFIYTKPKNKILFEGALFYPIAETGDVLLLENRKNGIKDFLASQIPVYESGVTGSVVMNCNPFTLGHRYLIEKALEKCDNLYIFLLSEEKSEFTFEERLMLVKEGTADLSNVTVYTTGDYLISSSTFPDYFLKEKSDATKVQCELDCEVFLSYFCPHYGIDMRFFGTEPYSLVTNEYNFVMKNVLPKSGITCYEVPRLELEDGSPVSASSVRALLGQGEGEKIKKLVPESTYNYFKYKGLI